MGVSETVRRLLAVRRFEHQRRLVVAQEEQAQRELYRPRTFELRSKGLPLRGRLG